jgi:hypothetical protein
VRKRARRIGFARLFEPHNRLVGTRLQQMGDPDPGIHIADEGIAGAEAEGLFLQRNYLLYWSGVQLAISESGYCNHPVAIERDRRLVFGDGLPPCIGLAPAGLGLSRNAQAGCALLGGKIKKMGSRRECAAPSRTPSRC